MRTILAILLFALPASADELALARARASAQIAIAAAARARHPKSDDAPAIVIPVPTAPAALSYADAFAKATKTGWPLVVFIRQPEAAMDGYYTANMICCRDDSLAATPQVWVGIVQTSTGTMFRSVLDGTPTEADIKAAGHKLDKELNVPPAAVQTVATPGWSNTGSCRCQTATGKCQCIPASKCPNGCPSQPATTAPVTLPPSYFRSTMGSFAVPCST